MYLRVIAPFSLFIATAFAFAPRVLLQKANHVRSISDHSNTNLDVFKATWEPFHVPWSSTWENIEFDLETDKRDQALLGINDDFIKNDDFIQKELEDQIMKTAVAVKNERDPFFMKNENFDFDME
jgi:hypothetical protein